MLMTYKHVYNRQQETLASTSNVQYNQYNSNFNNLAVSWIGERCCMKFFMRENYA